MIVGIDEVGRGSWAGPLVAVAVILDTDIAGLKDSKLLTARQRINLARVIRQHSSSIGIGWVSAPRIDTLGMTAALRLAMSTALSQVNAPYDRVIIDGNLDYIQYKSEAIIKADMTISTVSAASIIAKVARDHYMQGMGKKFPGYGFEKHVGYGTERHREQLRIQGITPIHRLSFRPVKSYIH